MRLDSQTYCCKSRPIVLVVSPMACLDAPKQTAQSTLVAGWDWYAGDEASLIGADQYDFQAIVTHGLGHAVGLGRSDDTTSVMYNALGTNEVRIHRLIFG